MKLSFIKPQFFDIFGVPVFIFISLISWRLLIGAFVPRWIFMLMLIIGILGVIIDGFIVFRTYVKKRHK